MPTNWTPVPEPVTWPLPKPLPHGGMTYAQATVGAPTAGDIMAATAVSGASGMDVALRVIEAASAERVPYEVLKQQPHWWLEQVSEYFNAFAGAPAPGPLEAWREARRAAAKASTQPAAGAS
jgi:hypothetical protein